jgi:hypothetical protein
MTPDRQAGYADADFDELSSSLSVRAEGSRAVDRHGG